MQQDMAWIQHRFGINLAQIWHRYGRDAFGAKKERKKKSWEKMRVQMYIREDTLYNPPPPVTCYLFTWKIWKV